MIMPLTHASEEGFKVDFESHDDTSPQRRLGGEE